MSVLRTILATTIIIITIIIRHLGRQCLEPPPGLVQSLLSTILAITSIIIVIIIIMIIITIIIITIQVGSA